jgi:bacteriorhodopsin
MIEQRRTRKESAISAAKWTVVFLAVLLVLAYWLYKTVANDPQAQYILVFQFKITVPFFTLLMFWFVYRINRNERTRQEIEDNDKAIARRYLAKYPELKDE